MKTNVLVDNILTEQNELDTQMLAIKAMGGDAAYNEAYKAHDGLRRAIAKRVLDTKKKRAKQFEAIRSMRTMLRTLVAEVDDNMDSRNNIQKFSRASMGTDTITYNKPYDLETHNQYIFHLTGPDPRSLLRPEINRDNRVRLGTAPASPTASQAMSYSLPTPPITPPAGRLVSLS